MNPPDEQWAARPRFVLLLAAFLSDLVLLSFVSDLSLDVRISRVAAALVMLVAVLAVGAPRSLVFLLFVPAIAAQAATTWLDTFPVILTATLLRLLFLAYVTSVVGAAVFRGRRVTMDTLAGAACTYVLVGMAWANLYVVLELFRPGSFAIPADWIVGPGHVVAPLTYFSFATMTTVGYVIHPVTLQASMLSVLEAVVGQLYLAIIIGRIVGLHTAQRSE
jgi:hypothetical protein